MKGLKPKQSGFTLIELMIVIVIVGILAAIAYPSYKDSVRKSRRNDGMSALLAAAQKLDVYRAREASFTTKASEAGINSTVSPEGYYDTLNIEAGPCGNIRNCYTISIVPTTLHGQNNDSVTGYRLHSTGLKQREEDGTWTSGWK